MMKFLKAKNKIPKIIAIFVLLLFIVSYACMDELQDSLGDGNDTRAIEYAKGWYEANKPEELSFRSSGGREKVPMKPEWKNAFSNKNKKYEMVETDLMIQGIIRYTDKDCMEKYKETGDMKYKQSYTRIVFRTDRTTNETVGFLMTLVPNLEFLEKSKFKPFKKTCYLDRDKDFGGIILFHNMDGSFSNGWAYEKGKITGSIGALEEKPAEISLRSTTCYWVDNYYEYTQCTDWYSGSEEYGFQYTGTTCYSWLEYSHSYEVCHNDDGNGEYNGDSGNGGGNGSGNSTIPETRDDCPPQAAANGTAINNVLNNENTDYAKVKPLINQLKGYASSQSDEYALGVQYASGQYYVLNINTNPDNPNYFASGAPNGVYVSTTYNTYLIAHTHPAGSNAAPSPLDATMLADVYFNGSPNITANVIFAANGAEYMVYINNPTSLAMFYNSSYYSSFQASGSLFQTGSIWATDYNAAYNSMISKGFSANDAQSYALSFVLDKYDTGLKIYEKKSENFKEQKTDLSGNNYSPKICQ